MAEAPAATPTALDDKVLSAIAKAEYTAERLEWHAGNVAMFQRLSLEGKTTTADSVQYLESQKEKVEELTKQRGRELRRLAYLQAKQAVQAGATKQQNAG